MKPKSFPTVSPCIDPLEARLLFSGALLHTTALLSAPGGGITAASEGDVAIFFGGANELTSSHVVDIYNARTGTWSSGIEPAGTGRVAAGTDGKIIFPGFVGTGEEFDTANGQWSPLSLGSLPSTVGFTLPGGNLLFSGGGKHSYIYDAQSGSVRATRFAGVRAVAGTKLISVDDTLYANAAAVTTFDTLSGETVFSKAPVHSSAGIEAVPIGHDLLIISDNNGSHGSAYLFDTVTGTGRSISIPKNIEIPSYLRSAAVVGDNAVFAYAYTPDSRGRFFPTGVGTYNLTTGSWGTSPIQDAQLIGPAVIAVDNQVVVAGGYLTGPPGLGSANVDIYTDTAPSAELAGGVAGHKSGTAAVVVTNTGDAPFTGPYTVNVYATPPGQYHGSVLLGTQTVNRSLPAGASARLSVPITLPPGIPAGTYHLVAMVQAANGTLTPFAGGTATFTVPPQPTATAAPAAAPRPASGTTAWPFSLASHRRSWLEAD